MEEISYLRFLSLENKIRGLVELACDKEQAYEARFYSLSDNTLSTLFSATHEDIDFDEQHADGSYLVFKAIVERGELSVLELEILADGRMDFCVTASLPKFLMSDSWDEITAFDDGGRKLSLLSADFTDIELAINNVLFVSQLEHEPSDPKELKEATIELNQFAEKYHE